ncbi:MAG TPA: glycosyltransferase family 2 protein [Lacunisphaera sp.]|jgi:dolichol-phosphate mannosyltransferase|nr:glycosyltransferase family 2 protein [Lacunisphaera sp.]
MPKLSVVVAAYNEEGNLPLLYQRVAALDWAGLGLEVEFIFVDDHSRDGTPRLLRELAAQDPRVKVLRFSKNFGSHKAFTAGLEHCTGDAAVILAADLQDPPETIPQLVAKWRAGAKVVWAVRAERAGVSLADKLFARFYYWLMRRFADVQPPREGADFLLVDRCVLDELRATPEKNTSVLLLIQWMGFPQDFISYTKAARHSGRSKWTFSKKLKLAIDSLAGFSYAPIRLASLFGVLFAVTGFIYALVVAARAIWWGSPVAGWPALMCVVLITAGVQLLILGVLGEYLWRTYEESRHRPRYLVEDRINL